MTVAPGTPHPTPPGARSPRFVTGTERWRAPVRQHRHPGGRWGGRLLTAVLLVVVLVAGGAVLDTRLTDDQVVRPFYVRGEVAEPVATAEFEITVRRVRTAAEVTDRPGWRHDTSGVWILVLVRAQALREPVSIGDAGLRASDGRVWLASERVRQPLARYSHQLQPGIPVEAELVFEVPRTVATDLVLQVAPRSFHASRLAAVGEVPLPVDEAMVAEGLALGEPVEVAQVEVVAGTPLRLEPAEVGR